MMRIDIIFITCFLIQIIYSQNLCSNFDYGIDRPGPWYAHIPSTLTPESCCALCNAENEKCQSWIFIRPGSASPSGCYLKQNLPTINESSTCGQYCISSYKQTSVIISGRCANPGGLFELGVDRPGSTYAILTSPTNHSACCAMCQMEGAKCRAWTFIRNGAPGKQSGCALKNQIPSISNIPCVACTSGIK